MVDISSRDSTVIPTDEHNLIYWAAKRLYEQCGRKLPGLRLVQENNIPMARGLGSSSSCIVAGNFRRQPFAGHSFLTKGSCEFCGKDRRPPRQYDAGD